MAHPSCRRQLVACLLMQCFVSIRLAIAHGQLIASPYTFDNAAAARDVDLAVHSPVHGPPYSNKAFIPVSVKVGLGSGPTSNAIRERPQDWKVCISWMESTSEICQNLMGPSEFPNLPPQNMTSPQKYLFQTWVVHNSSAQGYRTGLAALTKVTYMVDPRIHSHGTSIDVDISILSPTPGVTYHDYDQIFPRIRLALLNGTLTESIRSRPQDWNLCYSWGLLGQDDFAYCSGVPELQVLAPYRPVKVTTLESRIFKAWLLDTTTAKFEAHAEVQYSVIPSSWDLMMHSTLSESPQKSHLVVVVGLEGSGHKAMDALWPSMTDRYSVDCGAAAVLFGIPYEWSPTKPPSDILAARSRISARLKNWEKWQLSNQRVIDDNGEGEAVLIFSTSHPYGMGGPLQRLDILTFLDVVDPDSSQLPLDYSSSTLHASSRSPFASVLILALDRDPVACLLSAVRQNILLTKDIDYQAAVVADNLMYLSAQLATLPCSRYRVLQYDAFVNNPHEVMDPLLAFIKLRRHLVFPENVRPPRNRTRQALERAAMVQASTVIRNGIAHPRRVAMWETFSNPKCPLIQNRVIGRSTWDSKDVELRDVILEIDANNDGELESHELYEWLHPQ